MVLKLGVQPTFQNLDHVFHQYTLQLDDSINRHNLHYCIVDLDPIRE